MPAPKEPDLSTYPGRFASRLKMLREKAGLSIDEMVTAMEAKGYPTASRTLYHWEAGRREPPLGALPVMASVLKQKSPRTLLPEK